MLLVTVSDFNKHPQIAVNQHLLLLSVCECRSVWTRDRRLTLPSSVCGTSVSMGSSRSCVWQGPGPGGRRPEILLSGQVYHTERAQWSSSRNTLRRSTHCWLKVRKIKAKTLIYLYSDQPVSVKYLQSHCTLFVFLSFAPHIFKDHFEITWGRSLTCINCWDCQ